VKVSIDAARCQGHGRCYDLAPETFGEDDEGYGQVLGPVPVGLEAQARLAAVNCPERAIDVVEEALR
jgi:ferredoxin